MDAQKKPLFLSLNQFTDGRINSLDQLKGKALPASVVAVAGSIVTVKFEIQSDFTLPQVTMPVFGSEYVRLPLQPGALGYVIPADASIGAMSGLGAGVASLTTPSNLGALVFFPIGNKNWSAVDPNVLVEYGPHGVLLRDVANTASLAVGQNQMVALIDTTSFTMSTTAITLSAGGFVVSIDAAGLHINGHLFSAHTHSGVTTGGGITGPVV